MTSLSTPLGSAAGMVNSSPHTGVKVLGFTVLLCLCLPKVRVTNGSDVPSSS
eukprot:CAMPEP_0182567114 /NCGR_PEP_ID=MMETSP1324-20130603/8413_1 /TAXON_ID=236786 /ORGANISM="Florenciella sp., Strain RCC1587" /LENGTH=51 /DNA_ID=CAMNT_0024781043 /DNA_START=432 /DNA_END=584 /DNA_ORIENTATION=+